MDHLRDYEKMVLRLLLEQRIPAREIEPAIDAAVILGYEWSPAGYFLNLKFPFLDKIMREVFSEPAISGSVEDFSCGFVLFAGRGELLFECHSWGDSDIPENFRNMNIQIGEAPTG